MNLFQPVEQWEDQRHQLLLVDLLPLTHAVVQALALDEVHDDVGGTVGLEEPHDLNDVRMVELGQRLGFAQELLKTPTIVRLGLARLRLHGGLRIPDGKAHRQVFLDRHLFFELYVLAEIGDAEPAMPQYVLDPVIV